MSFLPTPSCCSQPLFHDRIGIRPTAPAPAPAGAAPPPRPVVSLLNTIFCNGVQLSFLFHVKQAPIAAKLPTPMESQTTPTVTFKSK